MSTKQKKVGLQIFNVGLLLCTSASLEIKESRVGKDLNTTAPLGVQSVPFYLQVPIMPMNLRKGGASGLSSIGCAGDQEMVGTATWLIALF